MNNIIQFMQNNAAVCIVGAVTLIQIVPIKLNPWTWLGKIIGHATNGEVIAKFNEYKADTARYRIIRFDDEIRHSETPHTEEHYNQILSDIDMYERYCEDHEEYENNKAVAAIKNIKQMYEKHKADNSFLI